MRALVGERASAGEDDADIIDSFSIAELHVEEEDAKGDGEPAEVDTTTESVEAGGEVRRNESCENLIFS